MIFNQQGDKTIFSTVNTDENRLEEIIRIVMESETFIVDSISIKEMKDGSVGDVYHYFGEGRSSLNDSIQKFNVIHKIINRGKRFGDPQSWNREVKLYQTDIFGNLHDNFRVPQCYCIDEVSDYEVHIWMEYIEGANGDTMLKADYGIPAYHLGQFHGRLKNIPDYTWLSCRHTPIIYAIQWGTGSIDWMNQIKNHTIIPLDVRDKIMETWNNRDVFMNYLISLPTTLCHRDYNFENVFVNKDQKGHTQTTVIDWDTSGIGVLGEDIADFCLEVLFYTKIKTSEAFEIKDQVLTHYIEGLRNAGWKGEDSVVMAGYAITVSLHWTFRVINYLSDTKNIKKQERLIEIIRFCIKEADNAIKIINENSTKRDESEFITYIGAGIV